MAESRLTLFDNEKECKRMTVLFQRVFHTNTPRFHRYIYIYKTLGAYSCCCKCNKQAHSKVFHLSDQFVNFQVLAFQEFNASGICPKKKKTKQQGACALHFLPSVCLLPCCKVEEDTGAERKRQYAADHNSERATEEEAESSRHAKWAGLFLKEGIMTTKRLNRRILC